MIELLAPAGDKESFVTAIKHGANAVYVGYKDFNARGKIENFDFDTLSSLVSYAHLFNVKVYLTLNILIGDDEVNDALESVYRANSIGIDAFIVQDIGICSLIKKVYPGIELHASTQMGINNVQGAIVAERMGIKRIVLARETPISEIREIRKNTSLELEYFVQGALCVCYSGNCYMSGKLFNESGNRGKCLQLCRLPYTLKLGDRVIDKKYYLSTKDFCYAPKLNQLIEAGVTSLKIEGRARRSGYVARAVDVYRKLLDGDNYDKNLEDELKLAFNRGDYCVGYENGSENVMYPAVQNNIGISVGRVVYFERGSKFNIVGISSKREIGAKDVLKIMRDNKEVCSINSYDVKMQNGIYYVTTTAQMQKNDEVRMIIDYDEELDILKKDKRVDLECEFIAEYGKKAKLKYITTDGVVAEEESEKLVQKALSSPLSKENIITSVCKIGNDIFKVRSCKVMAENIFIAISELNELRRKTLSKLIKKMLDVYEEKNNIRKVVPYSFEGELISKQKTSQENKRIIIQIRDYTQLDNEIISMADYVVFKPTEYSQKYFKTLGQYIAKNNMKEKAAIFVPTILTSVDFAELDKLLRNISGIKIYINNISGLYFSFKGYEIIAGALMNIYNRFSVRFLELYNVSSLVLSPELSANQSNEINTRVLQNCYNIAYGYLPYMSVKHCPFRCYLGSKCDDCKYRDDLSLISSNGMELVYHRNKIINCYFELINKKPFDDVASYLSYEKSNMFFAFEDENIFKIKDILKKSVKN